MKTMRTQTSFLCFFVLVCVLFTGCGDKEPGGGSTSDQKGTRGSTLSVLTCSADGTAVEQNDVVIIDYSHGQEGYLQVNYIGSNDKVKLQITTPQNSTYTFTLHGQGYETFPLTGGSGTYQISVFENISGDQYATVLSKDLSIDITNEFGPYLYPNQYVDYAKSSAAIKKSEELAKTSDTDLDVVTNVYNYMISNFTYDYDKAASVASGYLPNVDEALKSEKGICFDYAAVMATMLRVQQIPTRLEIGYVGDIYHAWISVYIEDIGWINGIVRFDGNEWEMMDPTFASTSKDPEEFVPTSSDYLLKYVY